MLSSLDTFLIAVAAMAVAVFEICSVAYDVSVTRQRLRRHIDSVVFGRQGSIRPQERQPPFATTDERADVLSALRGDVLELARWLDRLHLSPARAPRLLTPLRLVGAAIAAAGLVLFGYHELAAGAVVLLAFGALGAGFGWNLPHWVLAHRTRERQRVIAGGLPEAIELLVVAVEAGLSLEDAIARVVAELWRSQPETAEELMLLGANLKVLPDRDEALRRLALRVDLPSVQSVVTTLSQTLRYGTPLAHGLRVVASELRNDALLRLEEQANRLPVLLTIPMIVFILPALFLIIGGPAFLRILDVLVGR